jgi:hypothetical protein
MRWFKPLLLALPFAIAAALNVLMWLFSHDPWRGLLVTRYAFLFAMPWARLLGELPIPNPHSHVLQVLLGYALVLYIPAALYGLGLWIILRIIQGWLDLFRQSQKNPPGDQTHG